MLMDDSFEDINETEYDDFDYNLDYLISYRYDFEFCGILAVYGITLVIGLLGNGLIIYTVSHFKRMRTLSNVFLASLASADLLLIIICVPVKFAQLFSFTWQLGAFLCKFVHYMQNVSAVCSVYTLTAMSIERYYAILYPVKSRYMCTMSQTRLVIILTWVFALLSATPILPLQVHLQVGSKYPGFWCVKDSESYTFWPFYECYMLTLILIIPCIVMTYTYGCICKKLWTVVQTRAAMFSGNGLVNKNYKITLQGKNELPIINEDRPFQDCSKLNMHQFVYVSKKELIGFNCGHDTTTVKQVIKMLVAVVILFMICWSPILIINILTAFGVIEQLNYGNLKIIRTIAHLLSYINSCVNPCIYGFMSKNFRSSFKLAFKSHFGFKKKTSSPIQITLYHFSTT